MRGSWLTVGACVIALVGGLYATGLLGGRTKDAELSRLERPAPDPGEPVLLGAPTAHPATRPAPQDPSPAGGSGRAGSNVVRVAGTVLDEAGRPLAGALVQAVGAPPGTPEATTGADGGFALELPAPGTFPLRITAPGQAEGRVEAEALGPGLRVTLTRGPTLSGTVLDAVTQAPVAGMLLIARPALSPGAVQGLVTHSREDGTFVLRLPAQGSYVLEVGGAGYPNEPVAEEYVPRWLSAATSGTTALRVLVTRGLTIEGRVLDDGGRVLERALIVETVGRLASGDPDFTRRRYTPLEDGRLRVPGLAPGRYDLFLRLVPRPEDGASSAAGATAVRDVPAGAAGIDVRLARGALIEGRLEDEQGASVRGAGKVYAWRESEVGQGMPVVGEVPGDGTFRVGPLPEGVRYDLVATGFPGRQEARTRGVAPRDARVVIVLPRGGRIAGRVLDAGGKPVPPDVTVGAVALEAPDGVQGTRVFARTGADGRFVLEGLAELAFEVQAGGGITGFLGESLHDVRPGVEDLVLRVSPGVELAGTLVDAKGEPVATTSLGANDGAHRAAMHPYAQVGPDGRFSLRGIQAGPVTLYTMRGGKAVELGTVEAPAKDLKVLVPDE